MSCQPGLHVVNWEDDLLSIRACGARASRVTAIFPLSLSDGKGMPLEDMRVRQEPYFEDKGAGRRSANGRVTH
jgi:hypothetical protein